MLCMQVLTADEISYYGHWRIWGEGKWDIPTKMPRPLAFYNTAESTKIVFGPLGELTTLLQTPLSTEKGYTPFPPHPIDAFGVSAQFGPLQLYSLD